jgi:hypothetical protein
VAIAAQDAGIPTLHVYETLIQIPVLVLDPLGAPLDEDDEDDEDEEEEEDSSPALNTEDVALRHLSAALDIVYGLNPRKEGR